MSKVKLGDVAELITKGTTPTSIGGTFTEFGINFVKSESIANSKHLNADIFEKIDEETDKKLKRSRLKNDDLLFSIAGAYLGKVAIVRDSDVPANTNQAVGIVRLKHDIVDKDYAYYFYSQKHITAYINNLSSQSSQPNLNLDLLGRLPFELKALKDQKKIAAVLSALDAKIDCNNRINAELEAMAKTLYDYWFVQFDFPFDFTQGRPDANGKPYQSSGGKMVYNATLKREIPAGWEAATLSQFVEFERGVTYGKEDVCTSDTQDSIGILRATNVTGNVVDVNDLVFVPTSKVSSAQTLKKFETLIVMSSGSKEHVGKNGIYYFDEPRGFGAFCSKITASSNHRFFVNTFLQSPWFKAHIKNSCLGTNINNLTNDHINDCLIAKPDGITSKLFEDKVSACYEKISNNARENQHLTQLRDWLLPMLMNGQVTVA